MDKGGDIQALVKSRPQAKELKRAEETADGEAAGADVGSINY